MSAYGSPLARNLPPLVEGKLPIVAQLEAASRQNELQCNPSGITDDNIENPTFIVLRILEKGQTFVSDYVRPLVIAVFIHCLCCEKFKALVGENYG